MADLLIGDRDRQIDHLHPQVAAVIQVLGLHPAPHDQARLQAQSGHGPDTFPFFRAHGGNADLQFRHAQRVQFAGDSQFFLTGEGHPRRLLAVAQGGVVDYDSACVAVHTRRLCSQIL